MAAKTAATKTAAARGRKATGLKVERRFTKDLKDPFASVEWATRSSRITNPDGSVVFAMDDAEIPASWSQVAADIMVSKYFRKAGVPQVDASGKAIIGDDGRPVLGPERSAKQVIHRLAGTWRHWGEGNGYFATKRDAQNFEDELKYMLVNQMAAPNSPQWFNTGLAHAYDITGPAQGHYYVDPASPEVVRESEDAYTRPQPHACFIQNVEDDLVNDNGIMDLWVREARLFKYGSGTGTNFSKIRGETEPLSGGGSSSGLMSFLKVGDRAAGAIKSGGTTRRAAKMVTLDVDHPDIEAFVDWKPREELKVAAMVEGMQHLSPAQRERATELGLELTYDYNGEAYATVSGQNSNNSVRLTNDFIDAVRDDSDWELIRRTDGSVHRTVRARDIWTRIAEAAWQCADPGVQFDTTINEWHTSPEGGRINASNPCVTGDTLVATTDGYRRIADLVGAVAEIIASDGGPSKVTEIFPTGIKPVYDLRTRSGYRLRLTADHRVMTSNRGDVPADQLQASDRVLLQGAGFGTRMLGDEIAEVLGVAVGDGCMTGKQGHVFITVSKQEREIAARLLESIDEFTGTGVDGRARRARTVYETPTSLRVGTSALPFRTIVSRYTVLDQGASEKRFTDEVFALDRETQSALLRGLFTADGTVADYGDRSQYVSLDSTSPVLLEQVQLMLLSFGIKAKMYRNRTVAGDHEMPGGTYQRRVMHSLRISRSSRLRFAEDVGFMPESPKAARLAAMNARVATYADR
ncbi:MAG: vitamin B12-dependent ribonucleotide reductase, partial [Chloroflexota bacterium]|nr:vitamin B12-dependent ribonucleotide reductase [Chloroflexota bacterium]